MNSRDTGRPRLALLGAGRAGGGLAVLLAHHGWPPAAVWSRTRRAAVRAARRVARVSPGHRPLPRATVRLDRALASASVLLVAVPDAALTTLAGLAAATGPAPSGGVALHLSGVRPARALDPLRAAGWKVGALHPLAVFPASAPPRDLLAGAAAAVEGGGRARRIAQAIARRVGALPFDLDPEARPAYHLAASLVANDTVALFVLALDLMRRAGVPGAVARCGLSHLLRGTARALAAAAPARALTGPVARGDGDTLRRHLQVAGPGIPGRVHRDLSRILVDLARQDGRLSPARARALRRLLSRAHPDPGQG